MIATNKLLFHTLNPLMWEQVRGSRHAEKMTMYVQPFAIGDPLRVQAQVDTDFTKALTLHIRTAPLVGTREYSRNGATVATCAFVRTVLSVGYEFLDAYLPLDLPLGMYYAEVRDADSVPYAYSHFFQVCEFTDDTIEINYSQDKNRFYAKFDDVTVGGEVLTDFFLRLRGGFREDEHTPQIQGDTFEQQDLIPYEIYSHAKETDILTIDPVPNWMADKVVQITCVKDKYIDGEKWNWTGKEIEYPDKNQVDRGMQLMKIHLSKDESIFEQGNSYGAYITDENDTPLETETNELLIL